MPRWIELDAEQDHEQPAQRRRRRRRTACAAAAAAACAASVSVCEIVPSTGRPSARSSLLAVANVAAQLAQREGRAAARAEPDDQHAEQQQRPVGRDRRARRARRIDHLELDRAALGLDLAAQAQLLAVLQQLVVLLAQHVVVAADPLRFGGAARDSAIWLRGDARRCSGSQRGGARLQRLDVGLALGRHRLERAVGRVRRAARAIAARPCACGAQRGDLVA